MLYGSNQFLLKVKKEENIFFYHRYFLSISLNEKTLKGLEGSV